jgi:hypothetical protein
VKRKGQSSFCCHTSNVHGTGTCFIILWNVLAIEEAWVNCTGYIVSGCQASRGLVGKLVEVTSRNRLVYAGIPYRNFFLFLNFIPVPYPVIFFHFSDGMSLFRFQESIPALLNFHLQHCLK